MVATTLAVAAVSAVVTERLAGRFQVVKDPKKDAGIKAAAGIALALVSVKVSNEYAKGALIGAGIGLVADAAGEFVPFLG